MTNTILAPDWLIPLRNRGMVYLNPAEWVVLLLPRIAPSTWGTFGLNQEPLFGEWWGDNG